MKKKKHTNASKNLLLNTYYIIHAHCEWVLTYILDVLSAAGPVGLEVLLQVPRLVPQGLLYGEDEVPVVLTLLHQLPQLVFLLLQLAAHSSKPD